MCISAKGDGSCNDNFVVHCVYRGNLDNFKCVGFFFFFEISLVAILFHDKKEWELN